MWSSLIKIAKNVTKVTNRKTLYMFTNVQHINVLFFLNLAKKRFNENS